MGNDKLKGRGGLSPLSDLDYKTHPCKRSGWEVGTTLKEEAKDEARW
jgi:hypothetical protein